MLTKHFLLPSGDNVHQGPGIPSFMYATEMRDLYVARPLRYLLVYHYELDPFVKNFFS